VSYNPSPGHARPVCAHNKLEGASLTADPFEHPINTVQVSRCIPFPGSLL